MTSRIIDTRSANLIPEATTTKATATTLQWMSVLKSLTGYQMYRREMQVRIQRQDVLRFLIYSNVFPRAIAYCVNQVEFCVSSLPDPGAVLGEIEVTGAAGTGRCGSAVLQRSIALSMIFR